ncbi:YaiO family outer membrane beta-barrel protein, partial [Phenylobacterium sp.]|uniref:YaiO family outer membrane beta-barrel protein n=1 Tax=Phenylobacterium sp. TaxID=1871053 RepID=UPI002DE340E6|nr:YaiO family outer membrane beta-barrel protein [Phenylobacterium sp.]
EVTDLVAQIARARSGLAHPWRLDLSASHASLSRGLPSSESASIFLGRTLPNKVSITAGFERVRQFNLQDTYYEVQIGAPGGYLAVGGAPNAHFRPKLSAHGGLEATPMPLGAGLSAKLGIDGGWSRYAVGDVWIANPFVTLLAGERLDLTARMINVIDETKTYRTGYGLAASWRPTPVLELSAGWIAAPESTDGVTVPVKATIVGLAWRVNDRLSLRLGGVREVRNAYTRNEITVGLTGRF